MSLAEIQEVPKNNLILLSGPPGAGKSTFCYQIVLNSIAEGNPIIFVTTEQSPSGILEHLKEKGMGEPAPGVMNFVDAFCQTVGLTITERPNIVSANCLDLNSISMATTRLQERIARRGILLAFDSLTSPYLFNGVEVTKFMRLFLSKFTAEGNSVLALVDEGCGKEEDLGAMMSVADGIMRMEIKEKTRIINVVKHPKIPPTKIEAPITWSPAITVKTFDPGLIRRAWDVSFSRQAGEQALRTEVGDFVNIFWMNLALWGSMLWDAKRVPTMIYEFQKEIGSRSIDVMSLAPWRVKLLMRLFMPKSFSEVKDMKKLASYLMKGVEKVGMGIWEYLKDASKKDEHYFRAYESSLCWGFDNVGTRLCFHGLGTMAGVLEGFERKERDWNVMETKCVGIGDPYCEFKAVPRETNELKDFLESVHNSVVEKVHDRLTNQLTGFLVHGKTLAERPRLGSGIGFGQMFLVTSLPALVSERYRMALRMGGAKTGKEVGEHLMEAGVTRDEAIERVIDFMNFCKVGKVEPGETIKIWDNCESFGLETGQPSCYFTTGFLNGLLSAVENKHVREIKCIGAGNPYCEWEII